MSALLWVSLIVVLLAAWMMLTYNRFVTLRNRVDEAWSDVEVQLQRRYNLIPNLVETVKSYAKHERTTLEKVTAARNAAMGAQSMEDHGKSENMLSSTLKSLFAVSEAYPDLKANQNFLELQSELRDAEDKIMAAWRFYNASTRAFNTSLQHAPANIVGSMFRFTVRDFFDVDAVAGPDAKKTPQVKF
jgi:LemA protein